MKSPTDEELAAAVEKIIAAVYEILPTLKIPIPDSLRFLTDEEWTKIRDDENRRRAQMRWLGTPEWDPTTKWEGVDHPSPYWKGCEARLQRKRGVDPEDARCRFPNCDELGCLRHLSERERAGLKRLDAERKAASSPRDRWSSRRSRW